jgi:hypothetical protein
MIEHETLLVTLVTLVSQIPVPPPPATRGRGRPRTYPDRLFLQALVSHSAPFVVVPRPVWGTPGRQARAVKACVYCHPLFVTILFLNHNFMQAEQPLFDLPG